MCVRTSADVLVGTANGQANGQAANDTALTPHSHANEDVGVPGGDEDDFVMHDAENRAPNRIDIAAVR